LIGSNPLLRWGAKATLGARPNALSRQASGCAFSIVSKTSIDALRLLEDLEVDAGVTYLDN
jgi:hypothetical protein